MRRVIFAAILISFTALAGCSDSAPPAEEDDENLPPVRVTDSTGAIRGLVLDPVIQPIAGAKVVLIGTEHEMETNEDGEFVFNELEPATYFIEASKLGFNSTQTDVTVVAGDDNPELKKMVLPFNPKSRPQAITTPWEGFLQCGAGAAGASTNPCFMSGSENTHVFSLQGSGQPDWVQVEMIWEGTNVFGDSLGIGIYDPATTASDFVGADCGSPCWFRVEGALMEEKLGESYADFLVRVFPGTNDGEGGSVVIEQGFTVYMTEFYRMSPDEGWLYVEDGNHPIES